jgi:DNA-binding NarL/FixJ family response regulator
MITPFYRAALRQTLRGQSDLEVVGEAEDGNEALELCRRARPTLVLMDVRMPNKQEMPHTIVLIITSFEDRDYLLEAHKAGAAGYVLKSATPEEIIEAIQKVLRACADRLATFHTCRFSERLSGLFITH